MATAVVPGGSQMEQVVFTTRVPPEVRVLVKASHGMEKVHFRRMIKLALSYLHGTMEPKDCEAALQVLCDTAEAQTEDNVLNVSTQYSGVLAILRAVLKINALTTRQEVLAANLINMGLPDDFVSDICRVVYGPQRTEINKQLRVATPCLPTISKLHWRVDVTISTSWLSRVLEPVVIMQLEMTDETSYSFQVPLSKFHLLRYNISKLLHQMEMLQNSSICKK